MTQTLIDLDSLRLARGAHDGPDSGLCFMEAVAFVRGLPHTDHPPCVSPVIGAFLRSWNDSLDDDNRQKLKPYIPAVVGTATTAHDEQRRAWLAVDWLARTFAPTWLDLAGLKEHAAALRGLPELTTDEVAAQSQAIIAAAVALAWAAAGDATGDAVWAAAWDAARDAARAAACDAADAVWAAARDAAWAAAAADARAAAGADGWDALQPTVVTLQASAFDLLDRMIAVGRATSPDR